MPLVQGLSFEPGDHIYRYRGARIPSVTGILEPYSGLEFVDPDHLAMLAEFGNHVHQAVHLWNIGDLDESTLDPALLPYLNGWRQYLDDTRAEIIASEMRVFSPTMRYAGTLDSILRIKKSDRLVDLKTGAAIPRTVGPQTAAYDHARREAVGGRLMKRGCLRLTGKDDGIGYTYHPLNDPRDFEVFKAALSLHRWQHGER